MASPASLLWVSLIFIFASLRLSSMPPNNITFYGDAYFSSNAISLTQEFFCPPTYSSSTSSVGRALYFSPIRFLDSKTNTTASFSCRFSFSINPHPICPFGDGFVFLITSDPDSFSFSSGYMGLPQLRADGNDSFLAVEFDTSFNPTVGDINGNHVGIDFNSVVSFASVDVVSRGLDLRSGRRVHVWIQYMDGPELIQVWMGYSSIRPPTPLLVAQIDLSKKFKEFMHVGFSASNGVGTATHFVEHWRFRTFKSSHSSAVDVDPFDEGYCLMCSPNDTINNDVASSHSREGRSSVRATAITMGGSAAVVISALAAVSMVAFFIVRKKLIACRRSDQTQSCRVQTSRLPARLSLSEIKSATMGFNRNRVVGEGASATVYKGSLPSGATVAVKRFDKKNKKDLSRNPFTNEFATLAGCLRHKNLVQLQGWCAEGSELVLVYEYMPNGSLDRILHKNSPSSVFLSWGLRVNIILGIASALSYLHEECERQIIHRDVKTCNVMLDDEFNSKLGDFGLAEVYDHTAAGREATIPAGTMGCLAPEYVYCGVPSVKSDVYSFGVVVLEVATGRRPVADDGSVLVDSVWSCWAKGQHLEAADSRLAGRYNAAEMERLLIVGLWCVHPNHQRRPTIKEAARVLRGEAPLPVLPPKKPTVRLQCAFAGGDVVDCGGGRSPVREEAPWFSPMSRRSPVREEAPWFSPMSHFSRNH